MWTSSSWDVGYSESIESIDKTKIYSYFTYGPSRIPYFITFLESDGSVVNTRYKSSLSWSAIYGSSVVEGYVGATFAWSYYYVIIYNLNASTFIVKQISGYLLLALGVDPLSKR